MRVTGASFLILVGGPLVVTARRARATEGEVTYWLEGLGWLVAASCVWMVISPRTYQRVARWALDLVATEGLTRVIGVLNVAFGLFLAWVAFFELG